MENIKTKQQKKVDKTDNVDVWMDNVYGLMVCYCVANGSVRLVTHTCW